MKKHYRALTTVNPSSVGQNFLVVTAPDFSWVVLIVRTPSTSSAMHWNNSNLSSTPWLIMFYIVDLLGHGICLCELFPQFKLYFWTLEENIEGDSPGVSLPADGDGGSHWHHHLPRDEWNSRGWEKTLKVLISIKIVRSNQIIHHGVMFVMINTGSGEWRVETTETGFVLQSVLLEN